MPDPAPVPATQVWVRTWESECLKWRGVVLTGERAHYCFDYDGLPVDETCVEWPCGCASLQWEQTNVTERKTTDEN